MLVVAAWVLAALLALLVLLVLVPVRYRLALQGAPGGVATWVLTASWLLGGVHVVARASRVELRVFGLPVRTRAPRPAPARGRRAWAGVGSRPRLREVLGVARRVVRALHLRVAGAARVGLGDPALTGWLFLGLAALPTGAVLQPDFLAPGFAGEVAASGWLVPVQVGLLSLPVLRRARAPRGGGGLKSVSAQAVITIKDGTVNVLPLGRGVALEHLLEAVPELLQRMRPAAK